MVGKILWYHKKYIITSNVGKTIPFFKKEMSLYLVFCTTPSISEYCFSYKGFKMLNIM
jgi:hypothetical protein